MERFDSEDSESGSYSFTNMTSQTSSTLEYVTSAATLSKIIDAGVKMSTLLYNKTPVSVTKPDVTVIASALAACGIVIVFMLIVVFKIRKRKRLYISKDENTQNGNVDCSVNVTIQGERDVNTKADDHTLEIGAHFSQQNVEYGNISTMPTQISEESNTEYENMEFPIMSESDVKENTSMRSGVKRKQSGKRQRFKNKIIRPRKEKTRSLPPITVAIKQTVRFPNTNHTEKTQAHISNTETNMDTRQKSVSSDDDEYMDMTIKLPHEMDSPPEFSRSLPIKFASLVQIIPKRTINVESDVTNSLHCNVQLSADIYTNVNAFDWSVTRARCDTSDSQKYCSMKRVNGLMTVPEEISGGKTKSTSVLRKHWDRLTFRRSKKPATKQEDSSSFTQDKDTKVEKQWSSRWPSSKRKAPITKECGDNPKSWSLGRNVKLKKECSSHQRTIEAFHFWKKKADANI